MKRDLIIRQTGYELPSVPRAIAGLFASKMPFDGVVYNGEFYAGAKKSVNPEVLFVGKYADKREIDDTDLFALRRGIEKIFGKDEFPEHIVIPGDEKGLDNLALYTAILKGFPHPSDVLVRKAA